MYVSRASVKGRVNVHGFFKTGKLESKEDGGTVTLIEKPLSSTAKPKVWIYPDMSDPTLKGPNEEGTMNESRRHRQ